MKLDETDNVPGFLKDKLSRNGSLSTAPTGLCLEGEENGAIPPDGTFYGIKDGKRGWFPVAVKEELVVVDVVWDPEKHQLIQYKKKVRVVESAESESAESEPDESVVFAATPLQDELL
jgi:hypothetical protein